VENQVGLETRKLKNLCVPSAPVPKGEGPGPPSAIVGNLTGTGATRLKRALIIIDICDSIAGYGYSEPYR
jgi:hypothetical protein